MPAGSLTAGPGRYDAGSHVQRGQAYFSPDWHRLALTVRSVVGTRMVHSILDTWTERLDFELPPPVDPKLSWRRCVDTSLEVPYDLSDPAGAPSFPAGRTARRPGQSVLVVAPLREAGDLRVCGAAGACSLHNSTRWAATSAIRRETLPMDSPSTGPADEPAEGPPNGPSERPPDGPAEGEPPDGPEQTVSPTPPPPPAVRAQLLATEHWSLLASRSTTQAEVLTRIAIFLTLVSAGLVGIGLLGQVTRFASWFAPAALGILAFLWVVGMLTLIRVGNASEEDMMYVVAMNRLRGAYVDLDPDIETYFLASANDDKAGLAVTYSFMRERTVSHLLGSSGVLIAVVTSTLLGLLAGGSVLAVGGQTLLAMAVGALLALLQAAASIAFGAWSYTSVWREHVPLRRTPASVKRWTTRKAATSDLLPEGASED